MRKSSFMFFALISQILLFPSMGQAFSVEFTNTHPDILVAASGGKCIGNMKNPTEGGFHPISSSSLATFDRYLTVQGCYAESGEAVDAVYFFHFRGNDLGRVRIRTGLKGPAGSRITDEVSVENNAGKTIKITAQKLDDDRAKISFSE